jgi:hypothetical protein
MTRVAEKKKGLTRTPTLKSLQAAFDELTSGWSQDTIFMAKSSLYLAEQITALREDLSALSDVLANLEETLGGQPAKKTRRQLSAYNRFVSQEMRARKSMQEVAAAWRAQAQS